VADDLIARRADDQPAYRFRFGFAYLLLAGVLGVAAGTAILLAGRPEGQSKAPWSEWEPTANQGGARIQQIAT